MRRRKVRSPLPDARQPLTLQITAQIEELTHILGPADMSRGYRETCVSASRADILRGLLGTLTRPYPHAHIIWLRGVPGSGKSVILNTIGKHLFELHRCGAFLFVNRGDAVTSDPRRVIPTLAYQLACFHPLFAQNIASQVYTRRDITYSSFETQVEYLLLKPLNAFAKSHDLGPIVIIFDAVDECGTSESRRGLLRALTALFEKLPSMFRVLIASRDEPDIRVALSHAAVEIRDLRIDDESTTSDIIHFFKDRLARIANDYALPPDWPGDQAIQRLVDLAGGLFIWASTTIRFIEGGLPEERLDRVLDRALDRQPTRRLDELYRVALAQPFDLADASVLAAVRPVLGAIVVAREPVTDELLSELLGLKLGIVRHILSHLRALLQGGSGVPIRILHQSFMDFLCDRERCQDLQWYIEPSDHHINLATGCFRLMERDLKFNIAGVETPYFGNHDIDRERIDGAITPALAYASTHWVTHLEFVSVSSDFLADALAYFIQDQFFFWLEVFSLTNRMALSSNILRRAAWWCSVSFFCYGVVNACSS